MTILYQASLILPLLCLTFLAYLFNKEILGVLSRLLFIEERLKLTQDGELRRMLAKSNETIKGLKKENERLKLGLEIKDMNDSFDKEFKL